MIEKIKRLLVRFREQILYLIFGVMTTAVDWGVSFLLYFFWGAAIEKTVYLVHAANTLAWAAAVVFAYVTNRIWVFQSKRRGCSAVAGEFLAFAGARVSTLLLQELIVFVLFDLLLWNVYLVKVIAAVFVVVANYFISKLLVFRKQK
ncbi:MAG: GtrA family protein [Ruminococcaceae bacterium]|nr:GtrA family protein [Oscillospiraceae bacterium]